MMEQNSRPGGRGIRRPAARARACRPSPGSPSRLFLKAHRGRTRPARRVSVWDYVYRCQDQVGEELAARGFVLDGGYVRDLHQGQCELALLTSGALIVEYLPRHGRCISAGEAASVALALLTSIHTPRWPAAGPGLTLHDEVSRLLRTAGMSAQEKNVRYDDGDIYPEVVVTNPAAPGRGFVRVIEASLVRWEFRFAVPGRCGLTPAEVADAVAAALVTARTDGVTQAGWVAS